MGNFQYWTKKLSYQKKCSCTSQNIILLFNAKSEKLLYPKAALRKVLNKAFIVCAAFLYKETLHGEPKFHFYSHFKNSLRRGTLQQKCWFSRAPPTKIQILCMLKRKVVKNLRKNSKLKAKITNFNTLRKKKN